MSAPWREQAMRTKAAGQELSWLPASDRTALLHGLSACLLAQRTAILNANRRDIAAASAAVAAGTLSQAMADRLLLDDAKLEALADGLEQLAEMPDPIGRTLRKTRIAADLELTQESVPLGMVLVIFEARPEALIQIAALALRSGNALMLKGGSEAHASNAVLATLVRDCLRELAGDACVDAVTLVDGRAAVQELLGYDDLFDLVIPRGSNALVRSIQGATRIPVLGHADGVCHIYVEASADGAMAERIVNDAKRDYPAACNAVETLLIDRAWPTEKRAALLTSLAGITLFALPGNENELSLPAAASAREEYGSLALSVGFVDGVDAAIAHINAFGSHHTDAIVTRNAEKAERFLRRVDSASVLHNASTRFADGFRYGLGAEVGVATGKLHARGPVGLDGLMTTRWRLLGKGQTVGDVKAGRLSYLHEDLK